MNAVNALLRQTQEDEFAEALAGANRWTEIARPLIMASIELERLAYDTLHAPLNKLAGDKAFEFVRDDMAKEAIGHVETAQGAIDEMLGDLRDAFIADFSKPWSQNLTEDEGEAVDQFNEALAEEVTSVDAFVKTVEREDYEAAFPHIAAMEREAGR